MKICPILPETANSAPQKSGFNGYTETQLVVRPWINHSATTIGYFCNDGRFVALADCSVGPDFAATYERMAHQFAAAPELLAVAKKIRDHATASSTWIDELVAAITKAEVGHQLDTDQQTAHQ